MLFSYNFVTFCIQLICSVSWYLKWTTFWHDYSMFCCFFPSLLRLEKSFKIWKILKNIQLYPWINILLIFHFYTDLPTYGYSFEWELYEYSFFQSFHHGWAGGEKYEVWEGRQIPRNCFSLMNCFHILNLEIISE